jgi:2-hydroxychromene-2-carboxylate isomerase
VEIVFYFDLGSPYAYLAAERLGALVPEPVRWEPVSLGALFKATGRSSWSLRDPATRQAGIAEVERRAAAYGLPRVRWPQPWPGNYLFAMRVATFAARAGRGRELALRAYRDAFQRGRDLGVREHALDAAAAAGLERAAVAEGAEQPAVKLALRTATAAAQARGVIGVPTLAVGERLFWGEDRLAEAVAAISGAA